MAARLKIDWQPLEAPGVDDQAEAATWADTRIGISLDSGGAVSLTRVLDRHAKSVRDSVFGTVLPLAEWIAASWPHIFHARRSPPEPGSSRKVRYRWDRVHRWRFTGEGTALPNLVFFPADEDTVKLAWEPDSLSVAPAPERVVFLAEKGECLIPLPGLRDTLQQFVSSVIQRLVTVAGEHPRTAELKSAWELACNEDHPDFHAKRLASQLNLLWRGLGPDLVQKFRALAGKPLNVVTTEILKVATLDDLDEQLGKADSAWGICKAADPAPPGWDSLCRKLMVRQPARAGEPPWRAGWRAAGLYRETIGLGSDQLPPFLDFGAGLVPIESSEVLGPADSMVAWSAGRMPIRFPSINTSKHKSRSLFARARDLYPILFGASPSTDRAVLFSTQLAGSSSVANAFAAEILAPAVRVSQLLSGEKFIDNEAVAEIASTLGAPFYCVFHQIENHGLATITQTTC